MAALPTAPFGPGGDTDGKGEYLAALQEVMQSLSARQGPNWFSVAGALLSPGRTGSAGEAFGAAASELGRQQAIQEQAAPNLAMMKAQIASQKYEMGNQTKAFELMGQALGTNAAGAQAAIASGDITPDQMARLAQVFPQVATLSPKVAEVVKGTFGMQNELRKAATEDLKAGMTQAELVAKYGSGVLSLIPGGGRLTGAPAPAPAAATGAAPGTPTPAQAPAPAPTQPATEELPLAARVEISKKRVEESDKPFVTMRNEIYNAPPSTLDASNTGLRQLDFYARTYPDVFALMQKQGLISGLATLAKEGINVDAGTFRARIGVPVDEFIKKVTLTPEKQQVVRDAGRIFATEFLNNMKSDRGLLGINPTDNDARLFLAKMASMEDNARAVQFWTRQQLLLNKQRAALFDSLNAHDSKMPEGAAPRSYFNSTDYKNILKQYDSYRDALFKDFYPQR